MFLIQGREKCKFELKSTKGRGVLQPQDGRGGRTTKAIRIVERVAL